MDAVLCMIQEMDSGASPETLRGGFAETRAQTLHLVETLARDDFVVQTAEYMSPPKWHLGHVSWMYEIIMSRIEPGYQFYSQEFSDYLNSYYNQFGEPRQKGRRGVVSRPTLDQILEYYGEVNRRVVTFLESHDEDGIRGLFQMGINHECQHQELMVYDMQHLLADRYAPAKRGREPRPSGNQEPGMIAVDGGIYHTGYPGSGFCYDIELPEHKVYLNDYSIGRFPVTNGEYLMFMEGGGYSDYRHWLADGWKRSREEKWESPMYWERGPDGWLTRDFAGLRPVNRREPVTNISYYEADAYARWAGMRLPTESEWEKAACWDPAAGTKAEFPWGNGPVVPRRCNVLESRLWKAAEVGSYPDGASPYGCQQMIGDVWEWTASEFAGYPGFKSAFREYNDKWFTGQKVLRGGSFGTPAASIRASYRNFFRLDERWMFAGFRLAADA